MEPFKALSLVATAAVMTLIGAGAGGFYAGYYAGRQNLEEFKAHLAANSPVVSLPSGGEGQPVVNLNMTPVLEEVRALAKDVEGLRAKADSTPAVSVPDYSDQLDAITDRLKAVSGKIENQEAAIAEIRKFTPSKAVLDEIKSLKENLNAMQLAATKPMVDELRYLGSQISALHQAEGSAASPVAEGSKSDPAVSGEVVQLRQLLATATEQVGRCKTQLAGYTNAAFQPQQPQQSGAAQTSPGSVVLTDNVVLKRDEEKLYNDIGVRLSLQGIAARQVKLAVNRQGFGLAFGERKVFRHQDVECELNLMETNLNQGEAKVSISCKR
jgi:hypothetical protein